MSKKKHVDISVNFASISSSPSIHLNYKIIKVVTLIPLKKTVHFQPHNLSHNILLTLSKVWYISLVSIAVVKRILWATWTILAAVKSNPLCLMYLESFYCCWECLQNQILSQSPLMLVFIWFKQSWTIVNSQDNEDFTDII